MSAKSTTVRRRIWFDAASIESTLAFPLEGEAAVAAAQEKAQVAEQDERKGGKRGKEGKASKKVTEKGKVKKVCELKLRAEKPRVSLRRSLE